MSDEKLRAVIITALPVETNAVLTHLGSSSTRKMPNGSNCWEGIFDQEWRILVHETGPGNVDAALGTADAINFFSPHVVLMVGVAGGRKDVKIGDVVISTKVYSYESGKDAAIFQPRPCIENSSHLLVQEARAMVQAKQWINRCHVASTTHTQLQVAPIASGEKVVADTSSGTATLLDTVLTDVVAVEMEGYGVLRAAQRNPEIHTTVVRGISDLLDGKSMADAAGSQKLAAGTASAAAYELLAQVAYAGFIKLQRPGELTIPSDLNEYSGSLDAGNLETTIRDFISAGKNKSALRALQLLDAIASPNSRETALSAQCKGDIARVEGRHEDAIELYSESRTLARTLGCNVIEAKAIRGLAELDRIRRRFPEATEKYTEAIALLDENEHPADLGYLQFGLAELANVRHDYLGAVDHYNCAHDYFGYAKEMRGLAMVKRGLGDLANKRGDKEEAESLIHEALEEFENQEAPLDEAHAARTLAEIQKNLGKSDIAEELYDRSFSLYNLVKNDLGAANSMMGLGDLRQRQGNYPEADQAYCEALRLARAGGGGAAEAHALSGLIELQVVTGNLPIDTVKVEQALKRYVEFEDKIGEANLRIFIAKAHLLEHRQDEASREFGLARELANEADYPMGLGNAESGLGEVAIQRGDPKMAERHFESAINLAADLFDSLGEANARLGLGRALEAQNKHDAAAEQYNSALETITNANSPGIEGMLLLQSAIHCINMGDLEEARKRAVNAEAIFESLGDEPRLNETRRLLDHIGTQE